VGLIVPGGWEEFFRFVGDIYDGPMWPEKDEGNPLEVLLPRLKEAQEKYDYVQVPDYENFGPQPWEETDSSLPGALSPYFLRAGQGPRYLLGGVVSSPLITPAESNGAFAVGSVEGSSYHQANPLLQGVKFSNSHHCFLVADGYFNFQIEERGTTQLGPAELLYIPKGTEFHVTFASRYAKAYVFSNGGGLVELFRRAGTPYRYTLIPEVDEPIDIQKLKDLGKDLGFTV
jgi:hypothetical protein